MIDCFVKIFDFFSNKKPIFYLLLIAIICLLSITVSSLKYNEDIYDFLPMDSDQQKAISLYQDISGGKRVVAIFGMKDGKEVDTDLLSEAVDTFVNKTNDNYGIIHISDIKSEVDLDMVMDVVDFIYQNIPLMLVDSDYVRMEHIIANPEFIKGQLEKDLQVIATNTSVFSDVNMESDPLALFTPVFDRMQMKQAGIPYEIENGKIFTKDKTKALVMITSAYGSMESSNNKLLINYLDSISNQTKALFPNIDIGITGSPVIAVDNANQIKEDSKWAVSISVFLILCLLVLAFRNIKHIFLIGFSILIGWLFAMSLIALLRSNVSLIVLGIGSIIIGIAVNYPLHFIAHIGHGETIRDVLKDMVPPLLIGNITTVGAFISLVPLEASALRDLGLFAAFMLIGTILFVLIFLPHLVNKKRSCQQEYLLFKNVSTSVNKPRGWLFTIILILTLIFGYFSFKTSFDSNIHHINYITPTQENLMADLHASIGFKDTSNIYLVSEGETWEDALSERLEISSLLDSLKNHNVITSYSDITSFICSEKDQIEKLKKWETFWDSHREDVIKLLRYYSPQYGFSKDAFNDFENIISEEHSPKSFKSFESLISSVFSQSFSKSNNMCSVVDIIDVNNSNKQHVKDFLNDRIGEKGYAFDFVGMNSDVANTLSKNFNYICFICGFIVFLFLWISFGRIELSLLAFLPMTLGWLWILGMMYLVDIQFNIVNVILATFIFGQGDDYTIFMTDGLINEYAYRKKLLPSYKNSIIISALIMFFGMGALIVAKHPALRSLAEVTIIGMFTVVMMAWIIPPMIFNWIVKTDNKYRRSPVTLEQIIRTTYCAVVYLTEISYGCIIGTILHLFPWKKDSCAKWFHRLIQKNMQVNINHIWGVKVRIDNSIDEKFGKGSIAICNHQSILDPIYLLALHSQFIVVVNERVWKNPIVHTMFKLAGYINVNQPIEKLQKDIAQAVEKGYNVLIFPEGKRNFEKITRFHTGAFNIAQKIGADILPLYIHGTGHVMPKGSGFAARGQINIKVGKRIPANRLSEYGFNIQNIAYSFQQHYIKMYEEMKREIEKTHYFHHYLIDTYTYKGINVERETRKLLKKYNDFSKWIDVYGKWLSDSNTITILNESRGQFSLMFALVHPELEVYSYINNPDDVKLALTCYPMPSNLHYYEGSKESKSNLLTSKKNIIDLSVLFLNVG